MAKQKPRHTRPVGHIYFFAIAWALFSIIFPMYKLSNLLIVLAISFSAAFIAKKAYFDRRAKKAEPVFYSEPKAEPQKTKEPEPAVSYGPQIDPIIAEGKTAQKEMGKLYSTIKNPEIRKKINRIMELSDKIVQDAIHDPSDIPQIQRFLDYYLPTTIKLLNAYDRMGNQGITGENITSSMSRIEDMLDAAIEAYEKQLDSLFANQALDIETDIQVMNSMIYREGLGTRDFK